MLSQDNSSFNLKSKLKKKKTSWKIWSVNSCTNGTQSEKVSCFFTFQTILIKLTKETQFRL